MIATHWIGDARRRQVRQFEKVQRDQPFAKSSKSMKDVSIGREGQAWKVYLEERCITRPIRRRMKHGIGVVEDGFRR